MRISDWGSDVCSSDLFRFMDETKKRLSDSKADAGIAIRQPDIVADELNLLIDGALGYAIYMLDRNGKVTIWNEGARRLTGWPDAAVIGMDAALRSGERRGGKEGGRTGRSRG